MIRRLFFGDAISATLPQNYLDLSESFLVPDNQCVYSNDKGSCFIIEFVQPQPLPDTESTKFYYNDIAHCNEGVSDDPTPQEIPIINSNVKYSAMIRGIQTSKKSNSQHQINVYVSLALYRFKNTDMLITLTSELEDEQSIWDSIIQSLNLSNVTKLLPEN